jgi:hypothetical protein
MSVDVAAGRAVLVGTHFSFQGTYGVDARSTTNLVVSAAHGTLDRKDLVVAKVEDQAYTGSTSAWSLAVVDGTAAVSPAEPDPPANSLTLAMIDVPAADGAIGSAQITDRRTYTGRAAALGGVIVCTSQTRPAQSAGRVIYETDTGNLLVSNGTTFGSVTAATFSTVIKTADESVTSSTTVQNDNHLVLAVTASTNYLVEAWVACDGNSGGSGPNLKVSWAGPTGATMRWGWGLEDELSSDTGTWETTISTTETISSSDFGGDDVLVFVKGVLQVSTTAGSLQLKWAQASSSSTATRVFTGSALRITPVT